MQPFRDRNEGGQVLAIIAIIPTRSCSHYHAAAYRLGQVAGALNAPLDVFIVRKLGLRGMKSTRWVRSRAAASW